jgi:alkanesulfonate monooxygenase SsuD/methylene tetrahydromethanopterin reductase-like flavin-dependent oxidoreductase (luciferase family)
MTRVGGHDLMLGVFLTPSSRDPAAVVRRAVLAEEAGLDLVTFQDHPYQPAFVDTWTLMSFVAARTSRVRLAANVTNLPLRPPAVLARSVASLDLLSGGRVELGLGAGAFWDAIVAMGGPRLSPGESLGAVEEAIDVARQVWDTDARGGVRVEGRVHRVVGAKRGPAPAHPVEIWVGGYGPRMLRLIGRVADGWLPSLGMLEGGVDALARMGAAVDEAAVDAGRDPATVRRVVNVSGRLTERSSGFLNGPAEQWAEDLASLALEHRVSTPVVATDDEATLEALGREVAPALRDLVASGQGG